MALDIENEVLNVVREVLRQPDLTVNDDFFEAGGSSLLVVQVIALLRDRGVRIQARSFVDNSQLAAIAASAQVLP